jgi:hypothetical protein
LAEAIVKLIQDREALDAMKRRSREGLGIGLTQYLWLGPLRSF